MKKTAFFLVILLTTLLAVLSACEAKTLSFSAEEWTIAQGDQATELPINITPKNASYTLTSSDSSVVLVEGVKVRGLKRGDAVITASFGSLSAQITVHVLGRKEKDKVTASFVIDNKIKFEKQFDFYASIKKDDLDLLYDPPVGYWYDNVWFTDEDCQNQAVFPCEIAASDLIFYSRWILADGSDPDHPLPLVTDPDNSSRALGLAFPDLPYENIVFPSNITTIAADAFKGNATLSTVDFNNVSVIEDSAFENAAKLQSIIIATDKLKILGKNAFKNSSLSDVNKGGDLSSLALTSVGDSPFDGTPYMDKFTRACYQLFPDETLRYKGFFLGKFLLGYDYDYISLKVDKTITLIYSNRNEVEVRCSFLDHPDVKITLIDYPTDLAENIREQFLSAGVNPENITIR